MKKFKKIILIATGSIAVALGVIGIFFPILPTTPFLLLAAYCYLKSSKKLYDWLIHHKILGIYIYNYITYRAVPRATKMGALLLLWLGLMISGILVNHFHVRLALLAVGIGVSIHILSLKTLNIKNFKSQRAETEK